MKIKDERSYLLVVIPKSGTPQTIELLDTNGDIVKKILINDHDRVRVSVPVGLTAIYNSPDYMKPKLYVNGAEKTTAELPPVLSIPGYLPTEHPRVGDIVVFEHP